MPFEPITEEEEFTAEDWKEAVGTFMPGGGDSFSNDAAEVIVPIRLPAAKIRSAITYILGYSFCDDGSNSFDLHRVPPVAVPFYGWQLRARSISFQRYAPDGNTDNPNNEPFREDGIVEAEMDNPHRYTNYREALATVRFGLAPYDLYTDEDEDWDGLESSRYCTRYDVEPNIEAISAETDRFLAFAEGPSGVINKDFAGSINELMMKTTFLLTWHEVPHEFVFNKTHIPQKILGCVGRVNDTEFMGFAAGTLFLQPPRFERFLFPYYTEDGTGRAYHYRIRFPFVHFDPTPGPGATSGVRGWNLFPSRVGGTNGGPAWFLATRKNASGATTGLSGPRFLETADFAQMFTHVLS